MAEYDSKDINGVTKVETDIGFIYNFTLMVIRTDTANKSMTKTPRGESDNEYVRFADINNKLGTQAIEQYVDALAVAGEYSGKDQDVPVLVSDVNTNNSNSSIAESLERIEQLLQDLNS